MSGFAKGLMVAALTYAALSWLFPHEPRRTIIIVPVMIRGDTEIPADPETGASDAPRAPFQTRDL